MVASNEAQPRHFEIETSLGTFGVPFSHISGLFDGSDILSKPGYLCLELDGSGTRINRRRISTFDEVYLWWELALIDYRLLLFFL